jgi:outer membrane protein OmpA-like peptidoglycan-associated protein
MFKLITITALIGLLTAPALAQVGVPKSSDGQVVITESQTPLFRVTVVGRTTPAINYRPRSGDTKVDLVGTPLMPNARGVAEVSGKKGYMEIEVHFDGMQPPASFGAEYLTYVLWAITPEGRAKNLGEVQIKDNDKRVEVTTELQAFALIVTAEPYFAVSQPSDVVVMENVVRDSTKGSVDTVQAKYELLKRGSYVMNHTNFKAKALEPGAPLDLAEARNAVDLARIAGADRYASDTFAKAQRLLADAEIAREKHKRGNDIMMPARQAAQTAEDARLVAVQRQEEALDAQQRVALAQRERIANERATEEAARRRLAELEAEKAAAAKAAEAEKTAAAKAEADRARLENERAHQEALKAQADAERARLAADDAKRSADADAERARLQAQQAQAAAAQAEQQKALAEQQRAQAEREKEALRDRLREQLNTVLETKETARGLIVNVSDVLFDTGSANLKPGAREKLARVAGILATQPDLHIVIEGHTDSVGTDDYNQRLSERRSEAVRTYLMQQKIPAGEVEARGFGESRPVASNDTAAGRQQNRRVEMVVTGESIGKTATVTGATQ